MSAIEIYAAPDGETRLTVTFEQDTVWLSQRQLAELFGKDVRTVNEHIRNVFREGELEKEAVVRNFRITAEDGKTYEVGHYNLDVIISWATGSSPARGYCFASGRRPG